MGKNRAERRAESHWDGHQHQIRQQLQAIATDEAVMQRFPHLAGTLYALAAATFEIVDRIDRDFSTDDALDSDAVFQMESIDALRRVALR